MIKKLGLFIFGLVSLGLINFSSAGSYTFTGNVSKRVNSSTSTSATSVNITQGFFIPYNYYSDVNGLIDIDCTISNLDTAGINFVLDSSGRGLSLYLSNIDTLLNSTNTSKIYSNPALYLQNGNFHFSFFSDRYLYGVGFSITYSRPNSTATFSFDFSCTVSGDNFVGDVSSGTCDYSDYELKSDITEIYCKNKFSSLMTSSECDSLYDGYVSPTLYENCTNSLNSCSGQLGICNSSLNSCLNGNYSGDIQWSSIWINNIQHLGNKNIFIDIPEEISWDYVYSGDNMNIDVEGYNVDTEYISGIISTQSSLPNQVDLNNLVKVILPLFVPGLVIILFIYFVFRFIKKIF